MKRLDAITGLSTTWANIEIGTRPDGFLYNHDPFKTPFGVYAKTEVIAPDGTVLSSNSPQQPDGIRATPQEVVTLENGNYVVLYTYGAGSYRPYVGVFDSEGNILTDAMQVQGVDGGDGGNHVLYSISPSPNGGFVVFAGDDSSNPGEDAPVSQLEFGNRKRGVDTRVNEYDENGDPIRDPYIGHETSALESWADANYSNNGTVLANGDLVIAYLEPNYGITTSPNQLAKGTGVGATIIRNGVATTHFAVHESFVAEVNNRSSFVDNALGITQRAYAPSAVALDNGGFAVIYTTQYFTREPLETFARFFDAAGTPGALVKLTGQGKIADGMVLTEFATLEDGKIAVLTHNVTSLSGREVFLTVFDETGVTDSVKVAELGTVQNRYGYDGVNVGADGSIYVTDDKGVVHRFLQSDGLLAPDAGGLVDGTRGGDTATGGKRGEIFAMGGGDDVAFGQGGRDRISGDNGDDQLEGGAGRDRLFGGDGDDMLLGGEDNDILRGQADDDVLVGGAGNDKANGGKGNDEIWGNSGDDILRGGSGGDIIEGGEGNDRLFGNGGADRLDGGVGDDELKGGGGPDHFVFTSGSDTVIGFKDDIDTLVLDAALLGGVTGGRNIVKTFATVTADGVLFDFDGDQLLIRGFGDENLLRNDIELL
jgi:Ca2+-binding RTX toxin-like protein